MNKESISILFPMVNKESSFCPVNFSKFDKSRDNENLFVVKNYCILLLWNNSVPINFTSYKKKGVSYVHREAVFYGKRVDMIKNLINSSSMKLKEVDAFPFLDYKIKTTSVKSNIIVPIRDLSSKHLDRVNHELGLALHDGWRA